MGVVIVLWRLFSNRRRKNKSVSFSVKISILMSPCLRERGLRRFGEDCIECFLEVSCEVWVRVWSSVDIDDCVDRIVQPF